MKAYVFYSQNSWQKMPVRWEENDILVGRLRDIYWNNKNTNSSQQKKSEKDCMKDMKETTLGW